MAKPASTTRQEKAAVPRKRQKKSSRRRIAKLPPMETYSDERIAEFLLNNSADPGDYERARMEVRRLGLDPDEIDHDKPVEIQ